VTENEKWVPCPKPETGDVIRWDEPLWAEPNKPRGKPDKIGEQRLTARVLFIGDFLELEVLGVEKISAGAAALKVKLGDRIRRKFSTIALGKCHKNL
jgi:hypothetical protein